MDNPFPYTPVKFTFPLPAIRARGTLVSIGSCFSEHIAGSLLASGFKGSQNPNGIIYNPYSINYALQMLETSYTESDFFEFDGKFRSWAHHGAFSNESLEAAIECAEKSRRTFLKYLKKADCVIMTVSSAVVYRHLKLKKIVANCHKVPNSEFECTMLSVEQCRAAMIASCRRIRDFNKTAPIILTLSPVRHYPGDLAKNALSKARCLNALREAEKSVENCVYYPAYEIVTDELREYRFFDCDMLHPNETARGIILERFLSDCFVERALSDYREAERKIRQSRHIPMTNQGE